MKVNYEKLVSIIIPFYNGMEYFEETLVSLKNQTYRNIEIIVVNDNSSNDIDLKNIVKLKEKYDFKLLHHKYNQGTSRAFYTGANVANGEYFAFIGQDDLFEPTKIETQVSNLNSNPDYVANYTEIIRFYTDGSNLPESRLTFKNLLFSISENKVLEELYLNNSFSLSLQGLLIKKEILEKEIYPIWNKVLLDDWPVHIRLFEKYLGKIGLIQEPLAKHRVHSTNMSKNKITSLCLECDTVLNMVPNKYQDKAIRQHILHSGFIPQNTLRFKDIRHWFIQIKITNCVLKVKIFGKQVVSVNMRKS